VVVVEWTQSQKAAESDGSGLLPIERLQILQQRNLLFQFVESVTIHGLLASIGRIRQTALRSQARMVGVRGKFALWTPALSQNHRERTLVVAPIGAR
jgi:hypothetical protein